MVLGRNIPFGLLGWNIGGIIFIFMFIAMFNGLGGIIIGIGKGAMGGIAAAIDGGGPSGSP